MRPWEGPIVKKKRWIAFVLFSCLIGITLLGSGAAQAAPPIGDIYLPDPIEPRLPDLIQGPPIEIHTVRDLKDIWKKDHMNRHYVLKAHLDLKDVYWRPIGDTYGPFTGTFDGNGYTISNLTIRDETDSQHLHKGLFHAVGGKAVIKNLSLIDVRIEISGADSIAGALAASVGPDVTIDDVYVSGFVRGVTVGGLVGENEGRIVNGHAFVNLTGGRYVGGLVGRNAGTIEASRANGNVRFGAAAGGLVGRNEGSIEDSYARGAIADVTQAGGLVGESVGGTIARSYATGAVRGKENVGGLIGRVEAAAVVSDTYATGSVTGERRVGGLIGSAADADVARSYATGAVTGEEAVAALIGATSGNVSVSSLRWHTAKSGHATGIGGASASVEVLGLTEDEMTVAASFDGWNFDTVWGINQGKDYPHFGQPGVRGTGPLVFVDIRDHWAAEDIMKMAKAGVIDGIGNNRFDPEGQVTRAQFAKIIVLGLGLKPNPNPQLTFADTAQIPDWARGFVATAVEEGIIQGLDGNRFGPDQLVTREQIATMIARAGNLTSPAGTVPPVPDAAAVSDWAWESVYRVIGHRLMRFHSSGNFNPQLPGTRAEATSAVARLQPLLPARP